LSLTSVIGLLLEMVMLVFDIMIETTFTLLPLEYVSKHYNLTSLKRLDLVVHC